MRTLLIFLVVGRIFFSSSAIVAEEKISDQFFEVARYCATEPAKYWALWVKTCVDLLYEGVENEGEGYKLFLGIVLFPFAFLGGAILTIIGLILAGLFVIIGFILSLFGY